MNDNIDSESPPPPSSVFQSSLPIEAKLHRARMELLDLSARNRLLNIPRSSRIVRTVEIVDEKSSEIFRMLVRENRSFTFVPGRSATSADSQADVADLEEIADLAQPEDDGVNERGVFNRHSDTKLQTRLTSAGLQKRLLDLYADARTLEEEQGVNILFLALGTLKWIDPINASNVRYAPLILIPVSLERGTAAERFKLKCRPEEQAPNLSLEAYLEKTHGLKLPTADFGDDFDPTAYMGSVAETIATKKGWAVAPDDVVLGFFSFAKFLMYRDLDPAGWPAENKLTDLPLIRSLLSEGFPHVPDSIPESAPIDPFITPEDTIHVVDSDSSQTLAVHDIRRGRDLIIQGPPGTGKSQTITNVIASAIADGKTVLFVAEKMAALDVVKRRLDQVGVGDACLELHSNRANKKLLLDELRRTWSLGSPKGDFPNTLNAKLLRVRDTLNGHASRMHTVRNPSALTPYGIVGELVRLRRQGSPFTDLSLERPGEWTPEDRQERKLLLLELAQRVGEIGSPADHPWNGINLKVILPTQVDRIINRISDLKSRLDALAQRQGDLTAVFEMPAPAKLGDLGEVLAVSQRIASAPGNLGQVLAAPGWETERDAIADMLATGKEQSRISQELTGHITPKAWTTEANGARSVLGSLPSAVGPEWFSDITQIRVLVPDLVGLVTELRQRLGIEAELDTPLAIGRLIEIGRHVAAAPAASPEALTAAVWDHGLEHASDLVEAVSALEHARAEVGTFFTPSAWDHDLSSARSALAAHGGSALRFLSGDWRRADKLVKSFLPGKSPALDETLSMLDWLHRGQRALATVRAGDALGRAAFGGQWRAEHSVSAPLRALVDWVRELGPWAEEIRPIASRMSKAQREIGQCAIRAQLKSDELRERLTKVWKDLGASTVVLFGSATDIDDALLDRFMRSIDSFLRADELCHEILTEVPPKLPTRLELLDRLIQGQEAAKKLLNASPLGKSVFGPSWKDKESDWQFLDCAATWIDHNLDVRMLAARLPNRSELAVRAAELESDIAGFVQAADPVFEELCLDRIKVFGVQAIRDIPTSVLAQRLGNWISHSEQLSKWVAYRDRAERGWRLGLGQFVDRLEMGEFLPADVDATFDQAYFEALLSEQAAAEPELARFDGTVHSAFALEFAELDRERITAARLEVVHAHHRRIPPSNGAIGPLGILKAEMAKRRGHLPIRQLMSKAAPAIQALKPVIMMSPLSVAQFLPPGQLTFDLLVMDEASQIQPVDALGAIARCRQVVVVGDERQLPPTKFFAKMTGSLTEDEDSDNTQVADTESILGLFTARGMSQRMLRWHYRSRHQSLIAVSNTQFYENKLFIVPSPFTQEAGMGLRFHHVKDGVYEAGESRSNPIEAKRVAEAVVRHARENPNLSLGVATFSVKQRRAVQDQLELLRRANPDIEPFFQAHPNEPFFIKNLENVQGDERDVIFISVGYGNNTNGFMAMSFGPLSGEGGERRLNVLISRAKRRCDVFASITDEDIDLERGKGRGVFAFKLFMRYARTGNITMASTSGRDHDSVFEIQVANALSECGYQVHAQVGIAGFFIDLAIGDPVNPGRYVLGIECDGASYHSAQSARDRDRLRQSVLEDQGWIIHRIWSLDWFQRPKEQLQKTIGAIEAAKMELESRGRDRSNVIEEDSLKPFTLEVNGEPVFTLSAEDRTGKPAAAYLEATVVRPLGDCELHETPLSVLSGLVEHVVSIEGPVHLDEVSIRIRSAWGLLRTGARIQSCIERAAVQALGPRLTLCNGFLSVPGRPAVLRDRSNVKSTTLRRPEMLPPAEIEAGIRQTLSANLGGTRDETIQAVSRLLGFKATSSQLREIIDSAINTMLGQTVLTRQGDLLVLQPTP